jgi:hypothetical protein
MITGKVKQENQGRENQGESDARKVKQGSVKRKCKKEV